MTTDNKPYIPISCATHSEYELAIMRRARVNIQWKESDQIFDETALPVDLITRYKMEYLKFKTGGGEIREIRLDKITRFQVI